MKQILLIWLVIWATPYNRVSALDSGVAVHDHNCSLVSVEKFSTKVEADIYYAAMTEAQQKRAKVIQLNEE